MISPSAFIHPQALVEPGACVGAGTRVWAFAHLAKGSVVGTECNICDHTFIEGGARLGNRVTVKCGVYLWDGVTAEDDVFIGPCVVFTNDLRPRSKQYPDEFLKTRLEVGCSLGANATILPVTIGRSALIAAGAVVTRDAPAHALVMGNPARVTGWICRCGEKLEFREKSAANCACGKHFLRKSETFIEEFSP